ncbi:MAG: DUF3990 domain-containing protein [Candidatus Margulisbacteria bacterium]|jgi:hypothetical protein|nr:DUF3990 domain-containing protein [Candidatus Margulisiibacteriota bacterium]
MFLYHGSTIIVAKPQIVVTEYGRDFGVGFYTTDIKEQAARWALRKAKIEKRKNQTARAIVSKYEFDEKNFKNLCVINFSEPSEAWLDMVCACRSDINHKHNYDLVTGKIANDNVGETVSFVAQGIMRKEDALEKLKFERINNQICFATEKALSFLRYIDFEEL